MNGIRVRRLSGSPEDVTIQSTVQGTRRLAAPAVTREARDIWQEIRVGGNELLAIKANAKGVCCLELQGLGGSDGTLIVEQCGRRHYLAAGDSCRRWVAEGMTLIVRGEHLRMPDGRSML